MKVGPQVAQTKHIESANFELHSLKENLAETLSFVENMKTTSRLWKGCPCEPIFFKSHAYHHFTSLYTTCHFPTTHHWTRFFHPCMATHGYAWPHHIHFVPIPVSCPHLPIHIHTHYVPFYHYILPLMQLIHTQAFITSLLSHLPHIYVSISSL